MRHRRFARRDPNRRPLVHALEPRRLLSAAIDTVPLRVNAGGDWYTDSLARTFQPDAGFDGGTAVTAPAYDVQITTDDPLFSTYHAGSAFTFSAPVPAGRYELWLEFAEPDPAATAGQRVFSVQAEGTPTLADFDITAAAGGPQRAVAENVDVTITDGTLDLSFTASAGDAIVSAIVLTPTDPPPEAAPYSWQAFSDDARTVTDASHLRTLGQIIFFYANDFKGNLPADLATADAILHLTGLDTYVSPRAASDVPRGTVSSIERRAWINARHDYIYLGAGKTYRTLQPTDVLAYDNPDRIPGDINVLFADGHVEYLSRSDAAALIGVTDAPPSDPPPPPPAVPAPDPRILQSQSNLRLIAQKLQAFANDNRNIYPATLGTLVTAFDLSPATFLNPRSTTAVPPNAWTDAEAAAWVDAHSDFVFLGGGKRASQFGPGDVLAYEKSDGMTGGINLLFGDGHIEFREFPYADETLAPAIPPAVRDASFLSTPATQSLTFRFTEDASASLTASALTLTDSAGNPAAPGPVTLTYDRATQTATFSFPRLPTGLYHAQLSSAQIADTSGKHPAADIPFDFGYVADGTTLTLPAGQTVKLQNLTIDPGGTLDLSDATLILDYLFTPPTASLRAWLSSGRNGGTWDGPGIVTSNATLGTNRAIAYADATTLALSTVGGQAVDATALVLKYTYAGDANLDGVINADDYALADRGEAKGLDTWVYGDFDYDGAVTPADSALLNNSYAATQSPPPAPTTAPATVQSTVPAATSPSVVKIRPKKKQSAPKPTTHVKPKLNRVPTLKKRLLSHLKLLWHR